MTEVVSIKFKSRGKTYFFDPCGVQVADGDQVVVETSKGLELAECSTGNHMVEDERIVPPLRPVIRVATADDLRIGELCKAREKEAFAICEEKIRAHGLDMKLVDVECNFEGNKMLFFFTSDGRVDFRELVKDLAGIFRTRIELRQIGVRDEAKMLGGLGICGRPFCCSQFLEDFQPVSTKMAKTQSLSLNPTKISGTCGRLMCCLRYEQEAYEELVKTVPKNGAFVETPAGYGNVAQINLLRQKVKVKLDGDDETLRSYDAEEVAAVPGGRPKAGEPLPHVLKVKPKAVEPEEEKEDEWKLPELLSRPEPAAAPAESVTDEPKSGESGEAHKKSRHRSRHKKPAGDKPQSSGQTGQAQKSGAKPEAKGEQPAADKAKAPAEGGEQKKSSSSHHRSRHKKPSGGAQTGDKPKTPGETGRQGGQPKSGQTGNGQTSNAGSKPAAEKKPAPEGGKSAEGGEKKSGGSHHRRHYKPRGNGGAKTE